MTPNSTPFPWSKYVGHLVLARRNPDRPHSKYNGTYEYDLVEVSPSGLRVKFQTMSGAIFWAEHDDYQFLEDLGHSQQ